MISPLFEPEGNIRKATREEVCQRSRAKIFTDDKGKEADATARDLEFSIGSLSKLLKLGDASFARTS